MPILKQRVLALLAAGRFADLPSVATHVGVGFLLGFLAFYPPSYPNSLILSQSFAALTLVGGAFVAMGALIHVGGALVGGVIDARFGGEDHPDLPIPQGTLSAPLITLAGYALISATWIAACVAPQILLSAFGIPLEQVWRSIIYGRSILYGRLLDILSPFYIGITTAHVLVTLIYARTRNKAGKFAPIAKATNQALLVIWAAAAGRSIDIWEPIIELSPPVLCYAAATFLYTISFSVIARSGSNSESRRSDRLLRFLFLASPCFFCSGALFNNYHRSGIFFSEFYTPHIHLALFSLSLLFLAWSIYALTRLKSSSAFVSAALAGFCLMDACFAALIGWPIAVACALLFLITLLLQRIAPAT